MCKKTRIIIAVLFLVLTAIAFYQTILFQKIPFPGDLLLAEYQPWKSYSHAGYTPGAIPNKAQYFDAIRQMYPWQSFVADSLKKASFPFWNPYNFSGTPLLANSQSGILYPLKIFYLLVPQPIAWSILVILQVLLTFIGTYLLAKRLHISEKGSLLSAIAYGLCLYQTSFLEYNIMGHFLYLFAFSLWCIESYFFTTKTQYGVLLLVISTLSWYAGHLQLAAVMSFALVVYTSMRWFLYRQQTKKKHGVLLIGLIILSIPLSAPQLIPTIELILQSARSIQPPDFLINHLLVQPYQLFTILIPDLFGNPATRNYLLSDSYPTKALSIGAIPFILALSTFFQTKTHHIRFLWLILLPFIVVITRNPVSEFFFNLNIPIIGTSSPSNMIFIVSLFLSLLAGYGFDLVFTLKTKKKIILSVLSLSPFLLAYSFPFFGISISTKNLYMSLFITLSAIITVWIPHILPHSQKLFSFALIFITLSELCYFFWKFNPFVPISYMYPKTTVTEWLVKNTNNFDRVWGYGSAHTEANIQTLQKVSSAEGYDPLYIKSYGEFISSSKNGQISSEFSNINRSDAIINPGYGETDFSTNIYRQKMLSLLGVKYILARLEDPISEKTFPPKQYPLIADFDGWKVFLNSERYPRAYLVDKFIQYHSPQEFSSIFYQPGFNAQTTILTDEYIPLESTDLSLESSTKIVTYEPNSIIIETQSNKSALLFLSDSYYPGWNAYVDGKTTKIYRVNYAFRGVLVPQGNHVVTYSYNPKSFHYGIYCGLFTLLIVIVFIHIINKANTHR